MVTVCIPTLKRNDGQMEALLPYAYSMYGDVEIIVVRKNQSAAKNRNACINKATKEVIIMIDDDVIGFYDGWIDDLIHPLVISGDAYSIVSARHVGTRGNLQPMLGDCSSREIKGNYQKALHTKKTGLQMVGSACIAFKKEDGVRFDEEYIGAVFEDSDFCMEYRKQYPKKDIILNNLCKVIHLNEAKRGDNNNCIALNRKYFNKKWETNL